MYQIDVPSASPTLPAASAPGLAGFFTDGSVAGGIDPTVVPAEFLNAVMLELLGVVTAVGVVPTKGNNGQLLLAIQRLIEARSGNYALDTGVANAYVIALNPPVVANTNGLEVTFRARNAATGASTLDSGPGPVPLLRDDGGTVRKGDIPANSVVKANFDAAAGAFLLNSIVPSQLGALATLNIGAGLVVDGAGNLAVSTAGQASDLYFYSQF
jgi:hypothetical protein